jgi:hypothetical protein
VPEALNIISFDVPFPPNYGGVIDVYYKLVSLKKSGVKVILHCFTNGRQPAKELESLCEKVFYYPRESGFSSNLSALPYTVKSRQSQELEQNLLANDYPILFEVLHTCYLMKDPRFKNRKKIYRHSNIEHDYYNELSKSEKSLTKKVYLKVEAVKLRLFERVLAHADLILAVNKKDTAYFQQKFPTVESVYLPSFHPNSTSTIKEGISDYILFHGNLSVSENYEAAQWLAKHVFSRLNFKVVIAGLNAPDFLKQALSVYPNIQLKDSPNEEEMIQLIRNAQVHVLFTAQPTGLKLKLLNVLFKGRFVVCNPNMLSGTDIVADKTLLICHDAAEFVKQINAVFFREFTAEFIKQREKVTAQFDNDKNVRRLTELVFSKN